MNSQPDAEADLAFTRLLLDAGRAEPLPSARTAAALVTFAAGVAAVRGRELGSAAANGSTTVGAGSWGAAKWLVLGAVIGSATTFVWLQRAPTTDGKARSALTARPPATSAPIAAAATTEVATSLTDVAHTAAHDAESEPPVASASTSTSAPVRHPTRARPDLAAEVAALDGIRTALAIGAWRDAEQQLARYRREFARGALRNEAEVLSITSLVAQGRRPAAASAAKAFLAAHPRDPQAASVRALVE